MRGTDLANIICSRCLRPRAIPARRGFRHASNNASPDQSQDAPTKEPGAMSRRLEELSNESLNTSDPSAQKAVEEAGFSEELKARLEQKIADATFRSDNASAFAQAEMPSSAGQGTRNIAGATAWTGTESVEDALLRMLNDAYKPLRVQGPARTPAFRGPPSKIDTGRPSKKVPTGARLASARDKTSIYAELKDANMTEEERKKYRQELKERFAPAAPNAPASIKAIASLANQRIEDAIARGQFKNLPRGQHIERDHNASNPFLDTTEYFMNKIIQKQEIVPPWIEKQQELVSTATRFRAQLRSSWRRHVSRSIASRGGSLEAQVRVAETYAYAETVENPRKVRVEKLNTVDGQGQVSQLTLAGELKPALAETDDPHAAEEEFKALEQTFDDDGMLRPPSASATISVSTPAPAAPVAASNESPTREDPPTPTKPRLPTVRAFRDPAWNALELSYQTLAVSNLNSLNRSYNLMAPQLAQKPYFSLERELKACYADVAPQIADAIRERSQKRTIRGVEVIGHKPGSVLENFATSDSVRVYDDRRPEYGFRQFWRDLFGGERKA